MKNFLPVAALLLTSASCWTPGWSQTIYKCGSAYSQQPCLDAVTLDASDTRTPAQKAQTDAATRSAARMAEQLEKDRLAREKTLAAKPRKKSFSKAETAKAGNLTAGPKGSAKKKKEPEYFTAAVGPEPKEVKEVKAGKKSTATMPLSIADTSSQAVKP